MILSDQHFVNFSRFFTALDRFENCSNARLARTDEVLFEKMLYAADCSRLRALRCLFTGVSWKFEAFLSRTPDSRPAIRAGNAETEERTEKVRSRQDGQEHLEGIAKCIPARRRIVNRLEEL